MGKILNRIFVDGLNGLVLGIFSTLVFGTILRQVGMLIGGTIGRQVSTVGILVIGITGAGIGCGIAIKLKEDNLVVIAAAVAGMIGAFSDKIIAGDAIQFQSGMNLLVAFLAAYIATEIGRFLSGRTKLDLVLVPVVSILAGGAAGLFVSPFCGRAMDILVRLIHWGTQQNVLIMGAVIAVFMCMLTSLPVHMAALGAVLALSGEAAGAATIGCCSAMVGFAVASYKDNGAGGLLAQGLGSSVLQFPNIIRKPIIWIPVILTSAILGSIGTLDWFQMVNTKVGAVMGSSALIGNMKTYQTMIHSDEMMVLMLKIAAFHFVLPGVLTYIFAEFMRKNKWIKNGDMKINI